MDQRRVHPKELMRRSTQATIPPAKVSSILCTNDLRAAPRRVLFCRRRLNVRICSAGRAEKM